MSIEVEINEADAFFVVEPEYGRRVVFEVRQRLVNVARPGPHQGRRLAERYVVQLKGSDGDGFSAHTSFERACRSALWRARRYDKAYSKPHGVEAAQLRGAA